MEANLCLQTRHLPAKRHHKKIVVHSSVRLPALQAGAGPPPGTARVAVVGAGVVLACALGAMYWKRARALQIPPHRRSTTSYVGGDSDHLASGIVSIQELPSLLSEISIGKSDPTRPRLTEIIDQWLDGKDKENVSKGQSLKSVLEKKFQKSDPTTEPDYNFCLVLTLALIREKEYAKAQEICDKLIGVASTTDSRPKLFLAIIKMMVAMDSMVQSPGTTSKEDLTKKLKEVQEAWDHYKSAPDFPSAPPI